MRSILFTIILVINSALGFGQEAEFFVKKPVHKFPKAQEGILLEHSFTVVNTGDSPLIISEYKVECTCTKAILPTDPILPGKSAIIKVTFDTEGKSYYQDRIIFLQTNTKKKTEKLRFKVFVEPEQ